MMTDAQVDAVAAAVSARLEPRLAKLEAALGSSARAQSASPNGKLTNGALEDVLGGGGGATRTLGGDTAGGEAASLDDGWTDVLENDDQVATMLREMRSTASKLGASRLGGGRGSCSRQGTAALSPFGATRSSTLFVARTRDSRRDISRDSGGSWNTGSGRFLVRQLSQDALTRARELAKRRAEEKRSWVSTLCPTLHPEGRVRKFWNLLVVLLICFCAVAVPLEMGYERGMRSALGVAGWRAWSHFNLFVDLSFLMDILLNFRTGFMVEGEVVTETARIARHYLRSTFALDLIGAFPINIILDLASSEDDSGSGTARLNRQLRLLRFFKLNRLLRLSKLSTYLKYLELET